MIILSRFGESMQCPKCQREYDLVGRQPRCYMPCGHTVCQLCIQTNRSNSKLQCLVCKWSSSQTIPDYAMLDMVKEIIAKGQRKSAFNLSALSQIDLKVLQGLEMGSMEEQLESVKALRNQLTKSDPPIAEMIDIGLVGAFVELLDSPNVQVKFEACWALTNIASGSTEQTRRVVEAGVIPKLVDLVSSSRGDLAEQAIWTLGNIAGDCAQFRDLVLKSGPLVPIQQALKRFTTSSFQDNTLWALQNFCRWKPPVNLELVKPVMEMYAEYIEKNLNAEMLSNICWGVSYLTDGNNDRIAKVLPYFRIETLIDLMTHADERVIIPATRTIGNIASGTDEMTQKVLNCGLIPLLEKLASHSKEKIRQEVYWIVSNIAAGTVSQIQLLMDSQLLVMAKAALQTEPFKIQKEVAWIYANIMENNSEEFVKYLFELEIFELLCPLFKCSDDCLGDVVLNALVHLLNYDAEFNDRRLAARLKNEREDSDSCAALVEELLNSKNSKIIEEAQNVLNLINRV